MSIEKFNALKKQAIELGIDVKGKKMNELEELIATIKPVATQTVETKTVDGIGTAEVTKTTKTLGRPVNPDSVRQKVLAEKQALREAGLLKRGRKMVEGSKRQAVLAARAAKIAAGIELKPGRPKMTEEALAKAKAEREALKAAQTSVPAAVDTNIQIAE